MSWQDAVPVVLVAASVQLLEPPNEPDVGEDVKLTVPVGVLAPEEVVSATVAVHVVESPIAIEGGEHATVVEDGLGAVGASNVKVYVPPPDEQPPDAVDTVTVIE